MEQVGAEGGGRTILVVDSEPEIVELLEHMLRAIGYSVVSAVSRVDAIQLLQSVPIDLAVVEEHVLDGVEAGSVPILILSGSVERDACPADVLQKPFHFTELRERVAAAIRVTRSRSSTAITPRAAPSS